MTAMVLEGRKPGVKLQKDGSEVTMQSWADELFAKFTQVAEILDSANETKRYSAAVKVEWEKIDSYPVDERNAHFYKGHNVINLRAKTPINENLSIGIYVNNVTDKHYANRADFASTSSRCMNRCAPTPHLRIHRCQHRVLVEAQQLLMQSPAFGWGPMISLSLFSWSE